MLPRIHKWFLIIIQLLKFYHVNGLGKFRLSDATEMNTKKIKSHIDF